MAAICPKCGYEWETRAAGEMITCPSCHRKFARPAPTKIEVLGRKVPLKSKCDVCGYPYAELNVCRVDGEAAFICDECLARLTT
jgi:DNA-directed RNA polymerase subunit RPC12/RpoP